MSRHKERSPKPDGFGLLVEKFTLRRVIEISALGELRSATGGLQAVLFPDETRNPLYCKTFGTCMYDLTSNSHLKIKMHALPA